MKWILLPIAILLDTIGVAQDSLKRISIQQVEVYEKKLTEDQIKIDDPYKDRTLSVLLDKQTSFLIRTYGNGQLASISNRGMNNAQTKVFWNDIELNDPALGQLDLSIFSLHNIDQLNISPSKGGGVIEMKSQNKFLDKQEINWYHRIGSYGNNSSYADYHFSNNSYSSKTGIGYELGRNDYLYTSQVLADKPTIRLENAEVVHFHVNQEIGWKVSKNQEIGIFYTYHLLNRQIPPTSFQLRSTQRTEQQVHTAILNWKKRWGHWNYSYSGGIVYTDYNYFVRSNSNSEQTISKAFRNVVHVHRLFTQGKIHTQLRYDREFVLSDNYASAASRNVFHGDVLWHYAFLKQKLKTILGIHTSMYGSSWSKILPEIALSYMLRKNTSIRVSYNLTYRFPSLNDMYWNPGGNPDIRPEKNQHIDLSVHTIQRTKNNEFTIDASGYALLVHDYILWQPTLTGFWSPENIERVFSRGFETTASWYNSKKEHVQPTLSIRYQYTKATTLKPATNRHHQLMYIPKHTLFTNQEITLKWFVFFLSQEYVNHRFISNDESEFLPSFILLNGGVSKKWDTSFGKIYTSFSVDNITGTEYEWVARRPMPTRWYTLTIQYKIHWKRKHS